MANFTFTQCNVPYGSNYRDTDPTKRPGRGDLVIKTRILDFDSIFTEHGTTSTANDVFQVFDLDAGDTVIAAGVGVYEATTGAATGDLGFTGGNVDFFMDALALNDTSMPASTDGYFMGAAYCAVADTLDLKTLTAGGAGGACIVWALIARTAPRAPKS
ncbi:MAG: hypothetical protein ACXABY_08525 [Candidatus Thorarchaeota archaeon]|jgi:hypothetical protein